MPSAVLEQAEKFRWADALQLLEQGEDISEFLQPGDYRLHEVLISGYQRHLEWISDRNNMLMFELYNDLWFEENFAKDSIVKFIEALIVRGFNLSTITKDEKSTFERLQQLSPKLGEHLSPYIQVSKGRNTLLTLIYAQSKSVTLKSLTIPAQVNKAVADFLGLPLSKSTLNEIQSKHRNKPVISGG